MTALNYTTGTVSLTNGSAVVTGVGTAWQIALIVAGTIYVEAAGNPLPIGSVDSDTQITAAIAWAGATGEYNYVLRRSTTYDEQVAKNAEIFARLVAEIEAGTIWKYDASGDAAGKAFYDTRPKGFSYLEFADANAWLWVKASNDEGDWAGPYAYGRGDVGPAPTLAFSPVITGEPGTPASVVTTGTGPYNLAFTIPSGLTGIRWRGAYDAGTSYLERDGVRDNGSTWIAIQDTVGNAPPVLPVTSNAFWELVAAKGLDGTGTGDVVGPAGVTDGALVMFSGTTGKQVRAAGANLPQVTDLDAYLGTGFFYFGNSATGAPNQAGGAYDAVGWAVGYSGQHDQFVSTGTNNLYWRCNDGGTWSAWTRIDGNVNGPASAVAGQLAAFDGTTGRLLKAISIGTTAGTVAAGDDPRFSAGGKNDAAFALEIADLKGGRFGMVGGIADPFDDETGVDTTGSTNAVYDAANDWYTPSGPAAQTDGNGSNATSASIYTLISRTFALTNGEAIASIGLQAPAGGYDMTIKIVQRNAAGNYTVIASYAFTHPGGWADYVLPAPYTVPSSGTFHVGAVQLADRAITFRGIARSFIAGDALVGSATSGWTEDTGNAIPMRVTYLPKNMSLLSMAYTGAAAPEKGRLAVQVASGSPVINTDLMADLSRDGGTTWTTAALLASTALNGITMYEATDVDISGQPSGTSMKWRVRTANNKDVAVSGVVMQWS